MLDGAPLLADASIRDFREGRASYVANVVEQALLLFGDMADLRSLRKHEVFLSLKRDLALVSLSPSFFTFKITTVLYIYIYCTSFIGRLFKPHIGPRR